MEDMLIDSTDEDQAERQLRSAAYSLLANLLARPPQAELLSQLQQLQISEQDQQTDIGAAYAQLQQCAERFSESTINDEYHALFIGLARGELLPYSSYYKTGYLNDTPLRDLRQDLKVLGFSRHQDVMEPEDHISSLLEVMSFLIQTDDHRQQQFFQNHLDHWLDKFFNELKQAKSTQFYLSVACFGLAVMDFEKRYLVLN